MANATVELKDMTPRQAILAMLHGRSLTARQIANRLIAGGYRWPSGRHGIVSYDRVYSRLVQMRADGIVEDLPNPYDNGRMWRIVK